MYTLGIILFILSGIIVFGADRFYRKEKIKSLKSLLIIKVSALSVGIISVFLMLYGQR